MALEIQCPHCTGLFDANDVGRAHASGDTCPYCDFTLSVPDGYEIATVADSVLPDGTNRRVETARRRTDLRARARADCDAFLSHIGFSPAIISQFRGFAGSEPTHFTSSSADAGLSRPEASG